MSTKTSATTTDTAKSNKRTRLDRSLKVVYNGTAQEENANDTPSRRDGVSGATERLYRLYGASLIQQASQLLALSSDTNGGNGSIRPSTSITAAVIFQRLYHRLSLQALDVWAAAMGALFCAAKTEEIPLTARQVIVVFNHLYQRRRLLMLMDDNENSKKTRLLKHAQVVISSRHAATLNYAEKQQKLQAEIPALSSAGPIWKEWFDALVDAEGQILRSLGFLLYWIPNEHAHRFVPGFLQALDLMQDKELAQRVWNACNDAYRLDLCVRFPAEVICTAAIWISFETQPSNRDWWVALIGPDKAQSLADCANILLGIQGSNYESDLSFGSLIAQIAFLKPLVKESFNGPGSFLWEMAEGNL